MHTRRKRYWQQYIFPLYWILIISLLIVALNGRNSDAKSTPPVEKKTPQITSGTSLIQANPLASFDLAPNRRL